MNNIIDITDRNLVNYSAKERKFTAEASMLEHKGIRPTKHTDTMSMLRSDSPSYYILENPKKAVNGSVVFTKAQTETHHGDLKMTVYKPLIDYNRSHIMQWDTLKDLVLIVYND